EAALGGVAGDAGGRLAQIGVLAEEKQGHRASSPGPAPPSPASSSPASSSPASSSSGSLRIRRGSTVAGAGDGGTAGRAAAAGAAGAGAAAGAAGAAGALRLRAGTSR